MKKLFHTKNSSLEAVRKLKSKAGLSLVEMLATVVLVGLMGIVVATGVSTISNTYQKIVRKANEQTLLSTTVIELKNLLRYSSSVETKTVSGEQIFVQAVSQKGILFSLENSEEGIQIAYKLSETAEPKNIFLVSKYDGEISNVYSSFEKITYKDGVFTVTGLKVGDTKLDEPYQIARVGMTKGGAS